ncbi:MAG: 4'-phosphopantetheinyl transferase superfamily protein [Cognaticolwellia sp.]
MLNTFDIKTSDINDIKHTDSPYALLCNANDIQTKDIPLLASKLLSEHELKLMQRRKKITAKKEYIASRFLIKSLISKNLNLPYEQLELRFNSQNNKLQAIFQSQSVAVDISLAHSKGMIFFALSFAFSHIKTTLGVDIEEQNMKRDIVSVAEAFFHPDEVNTLTRRDYAKFYQLWTLKESLAKATGQSVFELLAQDTMLLLKEYQYALYQHANFQLAAIHNNQVNPMPCYLLDLEPLLNNHHE